VPDATDSNALVPHQLEELFNVNTTVASVGDVLTVTDVNEGVPTWEAVGPDGGAWLPVTLPLLSGDWLDTGDSESSIAGGVLTLGGSGADMYTTALSGAGVAFVNAAHRYEARFTLKVRRGDVNNLPDLDVDPAMMAITLFHYPRTLRWRWTDFSDDYQIDVWDNYGAHAWAPVDSPTSWQTIVATIRTPDWGPGFSVMVDGDDAASRQVDPDANDIFGIRFATASGWNPTIDIDLTDTMIEVRAI
jgi:hypothetical protein